MVGGGVVFRVGYDKQQGGYARLVGEFESRNLRLGTFKTETEN
jgi:hypothetical protein